MEFNTKLKSNEIVLVGSWKMDSGKIVADDIYHRIEELKSKYLRKFMVDKSGGETLNQNPSDSRYWLLICQNSDGMSEVLQL